MRGLANKGSTCYINVGLQCILTLETIRNYYIIGDYNIHAKNNSKPICDAFRHAALEIYAGNKTVGVPQPLWDATANKFDLLR